MSNIFDELKKMINDTEFSNTTKDKIRELAAKAKLKKESGVKDEECLTEEEKENLVNLIKADMVLDAMKARTYQAHLDEIDKIVSGIKK